MVVIPKRHSRRLTERTRRIDRVRGHVRAAQRKIRKPDPGRQGERDETRGDRARRGLAPSREDEQQRAGNRQRRRSDAPRCRCRRRAPTRARRARDRRDTSVSRRAASARSRRSRARGLRRASRASTPPSRRQRARRIRPRARRLRARRRRRCGSRTSAATLAPSALRTLMRNATLPSGTACDHAQPISTYAGKPVGCAIPRIQGTVSISPTSQKPASR